MDLTQLEAELEHIKQRNQKVEADKAWETSWLRVGFITLITYLVACLLLRALGAQHFFLNALLPAAGFFLSTQSLPWIKRWWIKRYIKD
jgi:hypothetical protein